MLSGYHNRQDHHDQISTWTQSSTPKSSCAAQRWRDFGDLEGWYETAWGVFQNKEANKAFIETNRGVTCNHAPTPPATNFEGVFVLTHKVFLTAPVQNLIPPPMESGPAPMDIDYAHQRGCFGTWAKTVVFKAKTLQP